MLTEIPVGFDDLLEVILKVGDTVELTSGDFLRVTAFNYNHSGQLLMHGHRFRRANSVNFCAMFPLNKNEMVWMVKLNADTNRNGQVEVHLINDAIGVRKLHLTNQLYSDLNFHEHVALTIPQMPSEDPHFCRYKYIEVEGTENNFNVERSVRVLRKLEADTGFFHGINGSIELQIDENSLRQRRIKNIPRGDKPGSISTPIDLTNERTSSLQTRGAYTFADVFCGAGGASKGGELAGFKILWGVDIDLNALISWSKNFPNADAWQASVEQYCSYSTVVDIAHISPVCKPWSPAKTHKTPENDEKNSATLFCVESVLIQCKPRIVTIEQTYGILFNSFRQEFNSMVYSFVQHGYSVRWKKVNFLQYGLPQPRKRMIMIACGPGEILPEFAAATHGPGLRPYTTINTTIGNIPANTANHDPASLRVDPVRFPKKDSGDSQVPHTITCGSHKENYHPTAHRAFTHRELALLQGLTMDFKFSEKKIMEQIGNTCPSLPFAIFFREIRRTLVRTDRLA